MKTLILFNILFLSLSSCSDGNIIRINVDDIANNCDTTIFHGIKIGMNYNELCATVGQPDDFLDDFAVYTYEDIDLEKIEHSPIYYFEDAKIICRLTGEESRIWDIVYVPYKSKHMRISNFLKHPLSYYNIEPNNKYHICYKVYKNDTLYFNILVFNNYIRDISVDEF